jgi:ornithine cyclodeaminase/alanine dehydrogenase-like protein (mu-crystallin family)
VTLSRKLLLRGSTPQWQHTWLTIGAVIAFIAAYCRDAADTDDEAHARADALVRAGVVLRFNGIVYLRPQEVSELVYRVG